MVQLKKYMELRTKECLMCSTKELGVAILLTAARQQALRDAFVQCEYYGIDSVCEIQCAIAKMHEEREGVSESIYGATSKTKGKFQRLLKKEYIELCERYDV